VLGDGACAHCVTLHPAFVHAVILPGYNTVSPRHEVKLVYVVVRTSTMAIVINKQYMSLFHNPGSEGSRAAAAGAAD
jgi:hypothetical protein